MQLVSFFMAKGELPSAASASIEELGLLRFLNSTIRPQHLAGTLNPGIADLLKEVPGALSPGPRTEPEADPGEDAGAPTQLSARDVAFERWLIRAEIYVERHGYRPTYAEDNGLYQWLNRTRRRLETDATAVPFVKRVRAILEYPDVRTFRYRAAHGQPTPGEGRRRILAGD